MMPSSRRASSMGRCMRTNATCAREAIGLGVGAMLFAAAIGSERAAPQGLADVMTALARIGERVEQYYRRAQSLVCVETVVIQSLGASFGPDPAARSADSRVRARSSGPNEAPNAGMPTASTQTRPRARRWDHPTAAPKRARAVVRYAR